MSDYTSEEEIMFDHPLRDIHQVKRVFESLSSLSDFEQESFLSKTRFLLKPLVPPQMKLYTSPLWGQVDLWRVHGNQPKLDYRYGYKPYTDSVPHREEFVLFWSPSYVLTFSSADRYEFDKICLIGWEDFRIRTKLYKY